MFRRFLIAAGIAIAFAGCSLLQPSPQQRAKDLDPMLSAAGFRIVPANTPQKIATLNKLPPLKVKFYTGKDGNLHYWLADPYECHCLYLGDETAYQHYENLRLQNRMVQEQQEAAEENMEASENMMMPPLGFGPGFGFGF
jgi:hypothetical protein